jgi:hypothetical protein
MVARADVNGPGGLARQALGLKMTFQAKVGVALDEHLVIDASMRVMAGGATFTNGFVLENERAALRGVALDASVALGGQRCAAAFNGPAFM